MLVEQNYRSVNHRYSEAGKPPPYFFERPPGVTLEPLTVLKALDCYEYQSCEDPGWADSEAAHFCEALRRATIRMLPGYDKAPWGIGSLAELRAPAKTAADPRLQQLLDAALGIYALAGHAADHHRKMVPVKALRRLEATAAGVREMVREQEGRA